MDPLRLIAALSLLAGLLWLAVRLVRARRPGGSALRLVQYFPLGPRRGVAALRVYDEILVLGVTPQAIRILRRYRADELPEDPPQGPGPADFRTILRGLGAGKER